MRKLIVVFVAICFATCGCQQHNLAKEHSFILWQGDLLFQDCDCGPLCDAIKKVTTGFNGAHFTHVGIVAKDANDNFIVIEAKQQGVQASPFDEFLNRCLDADHEPKVVVGRLNRSYRHLIPAAIKEAVALEGKPYDKAFVIDNDSYYCSELIYEIFRRANKGKPVFELQPMTFNDPDTGTVYPVWKEYFSNLNLPIPQGQPGINPGAISRSPAITIVHAYGTPERWGNPSDWQMTSGRTK